MYGIMNCTRYLSATEKRIFGSYLCKVCNTLAAKYGNSARRFANYDSAFLSLITEAQQGRNSKQPQSCTYKAKSNKTTSTADEYAAAVSVYMGYLKAIDDLIDEKSISTSLKFSFAYKKAQLAFKDLEALGFNHKAIDELLKKQFCLEKSNSVSLLRYAIPTEIIASKIFAHTAIISNQRSNSEILKRIGKNIGRIMYITDSYVDIENDTKQGTFNAISGKFDVKTKLNMQEKIRNVCLRICKKGLREIEIDLRSLKIKKFRHLIRKILVEALKNKISCIFNRPIMSACTKRLKILPLFLLLQQSGQCEQCDPCYEESKVICGTEPIACFTLGAMCAAGVLYMVVCCKSERR